MFFRGFTQLAGVFNKLAEAEQTLFPLVKSVSEAVTQLAGIVKITIIVYMREMKQKHLNKFFKAWSINPDIQGRQTASTIQVMKQNQ